ncbi:MAG: U32 family peptidase [Verrucomicrobiales bacterium]|nr:U32 family peptidase [Verrucomicrobiales bacterium]
MTGYLAAFMPSPARSRPSQPTELLAPAGNWECARAAVANGADAIYFGLTRFNARIRAENFTEEDLPELMAYLHRHGVRGLVAFNTLIFPRELEAAREQLRRLHEAGVDAIIVQDLGLASLARATVPDLALHASTQMTITSPEALEFVNRHFQLDRAVIARENSLREIRLFRATEPGAVPLETFVHGALCVAYSGQCLTSESLGQRSANRGECAQACRMTYDLIVDDEPVDLGDRRYLLSPQDLAGIDQIPALLEAGVTSFKIEGRLKSPEYVAAVTRVYRRALDEAGYRATPRDRYELEMAFSRGLSSGWLEGIDNQSLVHARFGKKRGAYIGEIAAVGPDWVEVEARVPVKNGDGVVFDTGGDTEREQGGRIYEIQGRRLFFQRGKLDTRRLRRGHRLWKTDDPQLNAELRKTWQSGERRAIKRSAVRWTFSGRAGEPARLRDDASGLEVTSEIALAVAEKRPLTAEYLRQQLGRLGDTELELESLTTELDGGLILPVSELNRLRRELAGLLAGLPAESAPCRIIEVPWSDLMPPRREPAERDPVLWVLCRTEGQIEAALEAGVGRIYADFEDLRRYGAAVERVRQAGGAEIFLATPRIQKAGELGLFKTVERAAPDGVLVRNLGGVGYFPGRGLKLAGDFSLNVANPVSAAFFQEQGLETLTISYDLDIGQVLDLLAMASPDGFELTLHQHMPMFHMEHCVFCAFLSTGKDFRDCGRPCDRHEVKMRDRVGQLHVLSADTGCRNTLFNGRAQSGARFLSDLTGSGLRSYRVELLRETREEAVRTIRIYQDLLAGRVSAEELWEVLRVESRLGVTEGTLAGVGR